MVKINRDNPSAPLLCIKIITIEERQAQLNRLMKVILSQLSSYVIYNYDLRTIDDKKNIKLTSKYVGDNPEVEIILILDRRGENNKGYKRNLANYFQKARGGLFVDDDDLIDKDCLIPMLYKIKTEDPDCIRLEGIITVNGENPKKFIHSIEYDGYSEDENAYYRPPNHLNYIKSIYSKKFLFPEIDHGEDTDWAMQIARSKVLKKESNINKVYYFYEYSDKK